MTTTTAPAQPAEKMRKPLAEFWRRFRKQKVALVALFVITLLVLMAVFAPFVAPYDMAAPDYNAVLEGPSAAHWAGTDAYGRDIFSRIIWGSRISLAVGFLSVTLGALGGVTLGIVSGYFGGWVDSVIMRFCDLLLAFPGILLAIGIVAILGSGMSNVILAVAIFSVPAFARLVRGDVLALKHQTYIEAVRSIGACDLTLIGRHLFPGTISSVVVYFTMRIGTSIITAASLSFLGLGAQPPTPEWGAMLNEARADMLNAPHTAIFPSLAIFLTVACATRSIRSSTDASHRTPACA